MRFPIERRQPEQPPNDQPPEVNLQRRALTVACVILVGSFMTLLVLSILGKVAPDLIADVCRWLIAISATAILGLITKGRS